MSDVKNVWATLFKTDGLREETRMLVDILQKYHFGVSLDELDIVDMHTQKRIHPNHLRSLLRNDYYANGGRLPRSEFNKILTAMLNQLPKACRKAAKEYPDNVQQLVYSEEYL